MTVHRPFITLFLLLLCRFAVPDATGSERRSGREHAGGLPEFEEVMANARSRLPDSPLLIEARLLTAQRVGVPEQVCRVRIMLALGREPPEARYTMLDASGEPLEQMTIAWGLKTAPQISYEKGSPLQPAPAPQLDEPVRETDIRWNDLTLAFLWWPHGAVAGTENRRGRNCIVVDFEQDCSTKRLWIDDDEFMIVHAEEFDPEGNRLRRLYVKSIGRIAGGWMVRDIEIRRYPSMARTLLRIDDIAEGLPPGSPAD